MSTSKIAALRPVRPPNWRCQKCYSRSGLKQRSTGSSPPASHAVERAGLKLPPNTREHLPYPTTWTSRSRWKLHPNLGFQRSNSARHLDAPEEKPQIIASDVSAPREQGGASSPLLFSSAASKWKKKRNMVGWVAPVVVAYRKLITNMFVWIWSLLLRPVFRRGSKAELSSSNR